MRARVSYLRAYDQAALRSGIAGFMGMVFTGCVAAQSMSGMNHEPLAPPDAPASVSAHEKTPASPPPAKAAGKAKPASHSGEAVHVSPEAQTSNDHAKHSPADNSASVPVSSQHARHQMPDLTPTRQYPRRPDGSISIPGENEVVLDNQTFSKVLIDELEYGKGGDADALGWQAQAWIGGDYDKLTVKTQGDRTNGRTLGSVETLWSHAFAAFWDWQAGVRHDFGSSPTRQWLAFAVQGTAPYWFDVNATAYVGPEGRTAVRLKSDYTFRLSQTTFLTPEIEINAYGKSDPAQDIGSGLADVSFGIRLSHEIRREIAPYIGFTWARKLGNTAELVRNAGEDVLERRVVAGVRIWF